MLTLLTGALPHPSETHVRIIEVTDASDHSLGVVNLPSSVTLFTSNGAWTGMTGPTGTWVGLPDLAKGIRTLTENAITTRQINLEDDRIDARARTASMPTHI